MKRAIVAIIAFIFAFAFLFAFAACSDNVSAITDIDCYSDMQKQADTIDVNYDCNENEPFEFSITSEIDLNDIMDIIFSETLSQIDDQPDGNHTTIAIHQGDKIYTLSISSISDGKKHYAFSSSKLYDKINELAEQAGAFSVELPLSNLFPWIGKLKEEDIIEVRYELGYIGVAPYQLRNICYSTDKTDISNVYKILSSTVHTIPISMGQVTGGAYTEYEFICENTSYTLRISNSRFYVDGQYYKYDGKFVKLSSPELTCNAFVTYPFCEEYEIYTYEENSVKVEEGDGLGEFEFKLYDGLIDVTPKYSLVADHMTLLILSEKLFMIEGDKNTQIYQITGEKDFSQLFL